MIEEVEVDIIAPQPVTVDIGESVPSQVTMVDVLPPAAPITGVYPPPIPAGGILYVGPTARFTSLIPSGIKLEIWDTSASAWVQVWQYTG